MQLSALLRRARAGALRNSLIVMGGYVLSRVTGLLRDVIASYFFGTSNAAAAYNYAFTVVDLLYLVIIGGALGSSFIPVFIEVWERDGQPRAWQLASAVVSWSLLVLTAASAAIFAAAPWLVRALYGGEGFDEPTLALTAQLTRLFLLSPLLLGLGGLAMAALNARDHFTLPALAPSIYNLGIIGGALLAPWLGIWGMAWGVVVGALLYLLVQLPGLFGIGMRLRLQLGRGMEEVGRVARQMGPRVLGQTAAHASFVVTFALVARLDDGDSKGAALKYAYGLMMLPYGVFSLSLSQVAFPRLARLVAENRRDELAADLRRTLATILWLTLPAATALLVLGLPATRALYQRGEFDALSLQYTAGALFGYALALPAFAASEILIRGFYAMQRTWTPVLIGLLQVALNLGVGSTLLRAGNDVGSLALSFSLANNLEALLLLVLMGRALPGIWRDAASWRTVAAALAGAALLGLALAGLDRASRSLVPALSAAHEYVWTRELPGLLAWLALAGGMGAAFYLVVTALFGAAPARAALGRLRR